MTEQGDVDPPRPLTPQEAADRAQANFTRSSAIDFTNVENPLTKPLLPGEDRTGRALPTQEEVEKRRTEIAMAQALEQGQQLRETRDRFQPQGSPTQRIKHLTSKPEETT